MDLKTCYQSFGGNYQDVAARLPSEALVRKLLLKFTEDPNFEALQESLISGDRETAFRSAHNIKGICLNLSFTQLQQSSSLLTEALRQGVDTPYATLQQLFQDVAVDYRAIMDAVAMLDL